MWPTVSALGGFFYMHDGDSAKFAEPSVLGVALLILGLLAISRVSKPRHRPPRPETPKGESGHKCEDGGAIRFAELARQEPPVDVNSPNQSTGEAIVWKWVKRTGVIAGIAYAVLTFFLWRDANRNFAIGERAWVGMTDQTIVAMNSEMIDARIVFTNTGKTPAHRVRKAMGMMIAPPPLRERPSDRDIGTLTFIGNSVLSPQAGMTLSSLSNPEEMATIKKAMENYFPLIESGTEILYLYGEIKYDDSADHPRLTKYCLYAYKTGVHWELAECNGFNEMD